MSNYKYEDFISESGNEFIKRTDGSDTITFIPKDESNSDYQTYLAWKAEQ